MKHPRYLRNNANRILYKIAEIYEIAEICDPCIYTLIDILILLKKSFFIKIKKAKKGQGNEGTNAQEIPRLPPSRYHVPLGLFLVGFSFKTVFIYIIIYIYISSTVKHWFSKSSLFEQIDSWTYFSNKKCIGFQMHSRFTNNYYKECVYTHTET